MIVEIEVQPETAALLADAQTRGVSLDVVLRSALYPNGEKTANGDKPLTLEEWETELQELIDSPAFARAAPLPDDAFSRESIYTREDEAL